ncbi:MAG: hypothetical protein Roseis2KO_34720 [Roseivirga sp.]
MAILQKDGARPFGKQTQFFEDMVRYYNTPQIQLLFFTPYDWDNDATTLRGLIFMNGCWQSDTVQKPTLVYDRSFSRDEKEKIWLNDFRHSLSDQGVSLFNPVAIQELATDKYKCAVWQESQGFTLLKTSPLSQVLSGNSEGIDWLYLKPRSGSRGIGVMKLHRIEGQYRLYYDQTRFKDFTSTESLAKHLGTFTVTDYIAQEEALLYKFRQVPFDLRLMVQDVNGNFSVTGEAIRLGNKGSIVSNLSAGGAAISLAELLDEMSETEAIQITSELIQAREDCLAFANALKADFGSFAELGFDILLTRDKGPVILEVNAKPSRWVFVQIADHEEQKGHDPTPYLDMRKKTVLYPIAYAERVLLG